VPAAQGVQPAPTPKKPATHTVHAAADTLPGAAVVVPTGQGEQAAPPAAEYEPTAHSAHAGAAPPAQPQLPSAGKRASVADPKEPASVHVKI